MNNQRRINKIYKSLMDLFYLYQDGDEKEPIEANLTILNMMFKLTFKCEYLGLEKDNEQSNK